MARYKKIPYEKVAEVYTKKAGNISSTCTSLGIDRNTFTAWRKKYPKLNQLLSDVDESLRQKAKNVAMWKALSKT